MAKAYTKEYLVSTVLWKYQGTSYSKQNSGTLNVMLNHHYDNVGKEEFRKACAITPEFLRMYETAQKKGLDFLEVSCYNGCYE